MAEVGRQCASCLTPLPPDAARCPSCGDVAAPDEEAIRDDVAARLARALAGRYRIERSLGEGGMAFVFLARDDRHDRPVAVKVLRPQIAKLLGDARFEREIQIAAQLSHPHVLPLHDSGVADGLPYFVMPYVEGESLRARLAREGSLPPAEAVRIAAEVADGLAYAHARGVVHRDIKPDNILLSATHAIIADFGIARALAGAGARLTTTGGAIGTPAYWSPEQAEGSRELDHRSDIYSLGKVLVEMLTGAIPLPGDPTPSLRVRSTSASTILEAALRRATARHPGDRFASVTEFRDAITRAVPPPRGTLWRAMRLFWTLPRAAAAAAALAMAIAAGWAALSRDPEFGLPLKVLVAQFTYADSLSRTAADRLTEVLTDRLQTIPELHVVARAELAPHRGSTLEQLRDRFHPARVIIGEMAAGPGGARFAARIVDGASGRQLGTYDTTAAADAVDAVADGVFAFVRRSFGRESDSLSLRERLGGTRARRLVDSALAARGEAMSAAGLRLGRAVFSSLDRADSLLVRAAAAERGNAFIPVLRARTVAARAFVVEFLRQADPAVGDLPDPLALRRDAVALLDSSLASEPGEPDAWLARGELLAAMQRVGGEDSLLETAIGDLQRARDLDRGRAETWSLLAEAYLQSGRATDALFAYESAMRVDHFQRRREVYLRGSFDAALLAEDFGRAADACATGLGEFPRDQRFRDCRLKLLSRRARTAADAARALALRDSLEGIERNATFRAMSDLYAAAALARAGRGAEADRIAARATSGVTPVPAVLMEAAWVRIQRGDPDSAIALLGAAVRALPGDRRAILQQPWFRSVRNDPRLDPAAEGPR